MRRWLMAKYGDVTKSEWIKEHGSAPVLLDAGCGAAMSGLALWEGGLDRINYIGVDISAAIDVAKKRFDEKKIKGSFIQCDLQTIPLPNESVDLIFSEGVLHHTDNTERALCSVVKHLKVNGRIMFYVYQKKVQSVNLRMIILEISFKIYLQKKAGVRCSLLANLECCSVSWILRLISPMIFPYLIFQKEG